jgi:glycosyltransferase involved in cell wall biosynthesis
VRIVYTSASAVPSYTANSIHVMKMCQAIARQGNQVILFVPKGRGESQLVGVDLWYHYGVEPLFEVFWLPAPGRLRHYVFAAFAIFRSYQLSADLIFSRHLPAAALAATVGFPTLFETHDVPSVQKDRMLFRALLASSGLRRVIVITDVLKKMLVGAYRGLLDADDVLVAPDGVDMDSFDNLPTSFDARRNLGLAHDRLTIGYAGHLYAGRGIGLILELARRFPDMIFLLVGGCPEDVARWQQRTNDVGLQNVTFQGFVPNGVLPLYLAACDVLLMPYERKVSVSGEGGNTARWMSPLKLFEYMATGRLIIASDLPVLHEILNDENALFATSDDVESWAIALARAND